jgi:hypothetical protein
MPAFTWVPKPPAACLSVAAMHFSNSCNYINLRSMSATNRPASEHNPR